MKITCNVRFSAPMYATVTTGGAWPEGVEIIAAPTLYCYEHGCVTVLTVRCELEVARELGFLPLTLVESVEHR